MALGNKRRYADLGPLHDVLLGACPPDARGRQSITILAGHLGVTHQRVYQWINRGKLPARQVLKIVSVSQGAVTRNELLPFVI